MLFEVLFFRNVFWRNAWSPTRGINSGWLQCEGGKFTSSTSEVFLQTPIRVDEVFTKSTGVAVSCGSSLAEINQALQSMKMLLLVFVTVYWYYIALLVWKIFTAFVDFFGREFVWSERLCLLWCPLPCHKIRAILLNMLLAVGAMDPSRELWCLYLSPPTHEMPGCFLSFASLLLIGCSTGWGERTRLLGCVGAY